MDRMKRTALLARLIEGLHKEGSWCGETHIQKATYFLQILVGVPLEFDFILYKHGPFSFDLRDELTALRADGLLRLESRRPYGAQMILNDDQSKYIQGLCPKTLAKYENHIDFVSQQLRNKGVVELERTATALYVKEQLPDDASEDEQVERLTKLKPHIPANDVRKAVQEVEKVVCAAGKQGLVGSTRRGCMA